MSTLKEKFLELAFAKISSEELRDKCEKIADDYAIEFLIHEYKVFSGKIMNYEYAKAMLKSFKKEKGL